LTQPAEKPALLTLGKTPVHTVLLLAWPAIIEQIMLSMVQYVDTAMVGAIGAQATAAVGLTSSTMWLINGIFNACGVGFSVLVAQYIGAGDLKRCRLIIRQSVLCVGFLGLLFTLFCQLIAGPLPSLLGADAAITGDATAYFRILTSVLLLQMGAAVFSAILRCAGDTRTPMVLNLSTNLLNILLNTLFIFGPSAHQTPFGVLRLPGLGLGVRGAALASAVSMGLVGFLLCAAALRQPGELRIRLQESWRPDRSVWQEAARYAVPVAVERATVTLGQIVFTAMVSRLGTVALAAHTLAVSAESITYLPATGISYAATSLVGQAKGAGLRKEAERFSYITMWMGIGLLGLTGVLLFFFSGPLVSIFTRDAAVIALGAGVLRIEALAEPFFGARIVLAGALRGAGDVRFQLWSGLACMWLVRLTVAWVMAFVFHWGLYGIWCGMAADITVNGLLFIWRLRSGRWYDQAPKRRAA
jgi:putative MATE family efflux protein